MVKKHVMQDPEIFYNVPLSHKHNLLEFKIPPVPEDTQEEQLELMRDITIGGYCNKTTITGRTAHVAVYPWYKRRSDVPQKPRRDRSADEIALANERASIQRGQDILCTNFGDGDIWATHTWDDEHLPSDEAGQMRSIENYRRRVWRLHVKKGGDRKDFKFFQTLEVDAAEGIRPNVHIVITSKLSRDEVEDLWKDGQRSEVRRVSEDKQGIMGLAVYITKPMGKRKRRWSCSTGLRQPDIRRAYTKTTKTSARKAIESTTAMQAYFAKMYPCWEITQISLPAFNDKNHGVYLYAQLRAKSVEAGKSIKTNHKNRS